MFSDISRLEIKDHRVGTSGRRIRREVAYRYRSALRRPRSLAKVVSTLRQKHGGYAGWLMRFIRDVARSLPIEDIWVGWAHSTKTPRQRYIDSLATSVSASSDAHCANRLRSPVCEWMIERRRSAYTLAIAAIPQSIMRLRSLGHKSGIITEESAVATFAAQ